MKNLILLGITLTVFSTTLHAEDIFPNVLVVHHNDGTEETFPLEGTNIDFIGMFQMKVVNNGIDHSYNPNLLWSITYEYRSPEQMGINLPTVNAEIVEVYTVGGMKLVSGPALSVWHTVASLPQGIYIVKKNGRTRKVKK